MQELELIYPKELVHKYGAKAGILMHVAKHLPRIPQAEMIVKTPDEAVDDFLKRAGKSILWPRVFRSSAVEELIGFEGDFPTFFLKGYDEARREITNPNYRGPYESREKFNSHVREVVERIENSPSEIEGHPELPKKICVIAAEQSPSLVSGTFVKHPNKKEFFIAALTYKFETIFGRDYAERSVFSLDRKHGLMPFDAFSTHSLEKDNDINMGVIKKDLEEVISWHNPIATLPEMDPRWTYQIEFGVNPPCLYQVRPFKPIEFADFRLREGDESPVAIGITRKEGIDCRKLIINHDTSEEDRANTEKHPLAVQTELRAAYLAENVPYVAAHLFASSHGMLAHGDIKAIRQAGVSILFPGDIPNYCNSSWINIKSDGHAVQIVPIKRK